MSDDLNFLMKARRDKLDALRAAGIAYPNDFDRVHLAGDYLGSWYAETSVWTGRQAAAAAKQQ